MEKETLYIPLVQKDFMPTNIREEIEAHVNKYNAERGTTPYDIVNVRAERIGKCCNERGVYEFARAMAVLQLAREGRSASRLWTLSADIAYANGDLEFCREFAIRESREGYSQELYNPLKRESADENVADIMGMITDELGELSEADYEELLKALAPLLVRWRALKVPKYKDEDAYDTMYGIVRHCYEHKAYHTALRLLALLYTVDAKNTKPNLINTNILAGKITYELGYMEVARRCFLFAAKDNSKKRRPPFPEEYRAFLEQETKLEVPKEVLERQKFIDDGIASGKIKAYTKEEVDQYFDGKLKIEFPDPKKQDEERKKIEEAADQYFMKANIYLEEDDLENAYACIKKAYGCKNGSKNGMVLLTTANILGRMGRNSEAAVYIFRSFILFGEEFIVEKLGERAMEALEGYINIMQK